jgi:hypothetical protein
LQIDNLSHRNEDIIGDLRVCRFLRATSGNVKEATEWFREFLQYRSETALDASRQEVIGKTPEELLAWWSDRSNPFLPFCPYAGRNQDGHIIWYMRQGYIDPQRFVDHRQIPMAEDLKCIHLLMEWTLWWLDKLSREEGRMLFVIKFNDFQGIGSGGRRLPFMVPAFKNFLVEMVKNDKKFYCEHNSLFLAVNIPFIFRALFSGAKAFLTKRQAGKIRLLGDTSQMPVREMMKRLIPESILPQEYGGSVVSAIGAFPLASEVQIDEWYRKRHLVTSDVPKDDSANEIFLTHITSVITHSTVRSAKPRKSRTLSSKSHQSDSQTPKASDVEDGSCPNESSFEIEESVSTEETCKNENIHVKTLRETSEEDKEKAPAKKVQRSEACCCFPSTRRQR